MAEELGHAEAPSHAEGPRAQREQLDATRRERHASKAMVAERPSPAARSRGGARVEEARDAAAARRARCSPATVGEWRRARCSRWPSAGGGGGDGGDGGGGGGSSGSSPLSKADRLGSSARCAR